MSGKKLLLDTNAVIGLLRGDTGISSLARDASWIGISVLSVLEYRSFRNLSEADIALFEEFARKISIIDLTNENSGLIENAVSIRKKYRFKLPDAIIIATALSCSAILVTGDKALAKIKETGVFLL